VVLIDPRKQEAVKSDPVLSGIDPDDKIVETEEQMIQSRSIAQKGGDDLNLKRDPAFTHPSIGILHSIKAMILGDDQPDDPNRVMTANLLGGLAVDRIGTSYAIRISWTGRDPV